MELSDLHQGDLVRSFVFNDLFLVIYSINSNIYFKSLTKYDWSNFLLEEGIIKVTTKLLKEDEDLEINTVEDLKYAKKYLLYHFIKYGLSYYKSTLWINLDYPGVTFSLTKSFKILLYSLRKITCKLNGEPVNAIFNK